MKHTTLRVARQRFRMPGRNRPGITQFELEQLSGVDRTCISKLESDVDPNPKFDTVRKLETALRLRPGTLLFGSPAPVAAGSAGGIVRMSRDA